jgi:RNase adaptor protein for sRNA GlmZ degradation
MNCAMPSELVHATTVAWKGTAVLLRGPSGAGKSDLALRLLDDGWSLVADDQTRLQRKADALAASAPEAISGRLEVRGLGIRQVPVLDEASVGLLVDLVAPEEVPRLPEDIWEEPLGVRLESLAPTATGSALVAARPAPEALRVVLVTGLSGAGRATALKGLEDLGYEAIDNLPLNLLEAIVVVGTLSRPIAVGVDTRTRDFAAEPVLDQLEVLAADEQLDLTLLFLDCDDDALKRRFTETRRRHPLAKGRPVADGIAVERRLVKPLRDRADLVIDTSKLSPWELRHVLSGHLKPFGSQGMSIFVTSFSYREGLPREADLVFDMRFLANPHYEPNLRPLTGRDQAVVDYIAADPHFAPFFTHLTAMLESLLPRYAAEGRSYLTIAIGCTGGRHRSVMTAEKLAAWLASKEHRINLNHRDVPLAADR